MYIPLDMCQKMDIRLIPDNNPWKEVLLQATDEPEEALRFLWDKDCQLLSETYAGHMKYLNDALLAKRRILYHAMGIEDYDEFILNRRQDIAYSQESISLFLMLEKWSKHKEVYKFDAELELALADSENVELPIRILDRLPFDTFYIEFAQDGIFSSNFHGAFITVIKNGPGYTILAQRVKDDYKSMFGSCCLVPTKNNTDAIFVFDKTSPSYSNTDRDKDWPEFTFFMLNALLYLCANNSEIKENDGTKATYRPTGNVKNKYSEVRKWDCGYRYGETIRASRNAKGETCEGVQKNRSEKKRHLPCVHTRKAHWHHYWTGKGRTELILKWVAPTIVGGNRVDVAVMHKVKE